MKIIYVVPVLLMLGTLFAADITIPVAVECACTDQFSTMQIQNNIMEANIKASINIFSNQTNSKLDAQQVNMESKLETMEQRMVKHIDDKIIQETDPLKFEMMGMFIGIGISGAIMALYISIGG